MKAFRCEDLKGFTRELFTRESFDGFLVREAVFVTFCRFAVEGKSELDWYSGEALEEERVEAYTAWRKLRPLCFSLIRGTKTPKAFQISFLLPPEETEKLLTRSGITDLSGDAAACFLNVRFSEGELRCVSAASLNVFSPRKDLEHAWDRTAELWFRSRGIAMREE